MKIEIFGLPGVGKTYILNLLSNKYPHIEQYFLKYNQCTRVEVIYDCSYYFKHPFVFFPLIFKKNLNDQLVRFKRIARRKRFIAKRDHCIMIDSGLIQPLLEAYILSNSYQRENYWITLFNELIMNHCYFFISDSIDNIVLREFNRPSRRFILNQNELTKKYTECQYLINLIKKNMYLYEFSLNSYTDTDVLIDDMYKKMMAVLNI